MPWDKHDTMSRVGAGDAHVDASSSSLAILTLSVFTDSFYLWTLVLYTW